MAWNPTPEVQVARDAAKALTKSGRFIDRCIVLYTTEQGQIAYASYGKDSAHCGQARRLADEAYDRVHQVFHENNEYHHRHDHQKLDGSAIDWDSLENEVMTKLNLLRESLRAFEGDADARHAYVRDLVIPAAELLGRFCACVNIQEDAM